MDCNTDFYVVVKPSAPVYLNKKIHSELADEVLYGMLVSIIDEVDQWAFIRTEYNYEGWMLKTDLSTSPTTSWKKRRNALVQYPFADLMPSPTFKGYPLVTLPRGSMVECLDDTPNNEGWLPVALENGQSGFCRFEGIRGTADLPDKNDEAAIRSAVQVDALSYLGTQYRWGGKTPAGIDCSGLAFMSYWMNGIQIYRDAQIKQGYLVQPIEDNEKQPGDLLYFPGHIALYLGDSQFVHSTGSRGGVLINSLNPESDIYHEELHKTQSNTGSIF